MASVGNLSSEAEAPPDYVAALKTRLGLDGDDMDRAWTPMPNWAGPWVVEDNGHDRWSVFRGRSGHITVIPLGNADRAREKHNARADMRRDPQAHGQAN